MEQLKTCQTCKYFLQHYIKSKKSYRSVHCGHCMYPRIKNRVAGTPACQHYIQKQ